MFCGVDVISVNASRAANTIRVRQDAGTKYDLSYDEVDRQLKLLSKTARTEDLWVYIEGGHKLFDVGRLGNGLEASVDYESLFEDRSVLKNASAVMIHNHPMSINDKEIYPPSFNDLWELAVRKLQFRREFNAKLRGVVYDGYGIWQYDMSYEMAEKFEKRETREKVQKNLRYLRYIFHLRDPRYRTRSSAVSKYVSEVAKLGIMIRYESNQ